MLKNQTQKDDKIHRLFHHPLGIVGHDTYIEALTPSSIHSLPLDAWPRNPPVARILLLETLVSQPTE
jgi:hypothetical protein